MSSAGRPGAPPRLGRAEFLALMGMLFATIAFSVDAMLPALPAIVEELSPDAPNRAQLIVTSFVLGMGVGTLATGPLSDAFGRKPTILGCAALYIFGAALAWAAPTLELMLAARVIQGLGAAGPRVVGLAIVRDLYAGREMARLVSFIFMVFSLFPAIAPLAGQGIIALFDWRAIFLMFILFAAATSLWLHLRQGETLPRQHRQAFRPAALLANVRKVLSNRTVRFTVAVQTFILAQLFAILSTTHPVFERIFGKADSFPLWFAGVALCAGLSSFVNARFVMTVGMRGMVIRTLAAVALVTLAALLLTPLTRPASGLHFAIYMVWMTTLFFQMGLTMGNLNALALEPMGALAGTATSIIGAISTACAALVAALIGQAFDGTTMPLMLASLLCGLVALSVMFLMGKDPENR